MRSRKVEFPGARGEKLTGLLDLPEDERPVACALFAHCFTCGKDIKAAAWLARALAREKIALLRFDFAGLGESGGDFATTSLSGNVADLVAAAAWLAEELEGPQLLIGHSFGGAAALRAAPQIVSARAVVTIAAPFDPRHVQQHLQPADTDPGLWQVAGRPFRLDDRLLEDLAADDPGHAVAELGLPLLVMHAPADKVVGIDNARQIYQAARHPKSFVSLDSADHLLSDPEDARYAARIIAAWASRYLKPVEAPGIESLVEDNRVTVRTGAEGFYTEMFANGHALVADEPVAVGGTGRGPTPYDYLLAALGACTSMTVQMYARRKGWPLQWAVTRLRHDKIHASDCEDCETRAGRIDRFERELELVGDLGEEQRARLVEIAEKCPVHRTLHSDVRVRTTLRPKEES